MSGGNLLCASVHRSSRNAAAHAGMTADTAAAEAEAMKVRAEAGAMKVPGAVAALQRQARAECAAAMEAARDLGVAAAT